MQQLRRTANRVFRMPTIADAFFLWVEQCERSQRRAQRKELRAAALSIDDERSALIEDLRDQLQDCKAKLAKADDDKRAALELQLVELTGSSAEVSALQGQREKEQRIELLRRQAARRILQQDLSRGWTAWHDMWSARTYALKRLRDAGSRLRTPGVAQAFHHWVSVWTRRKYRQKLAELDRETKTLEGQLRQARFEVGQANLIKVAQDDELKALREKVGELAAAHVATESQVPSYNDLRLENAELHEAAREAREAEALAEQRLENAEKDAASQRSKDQRLLQQLLAEQRSKFDVELGAMKDQLEAKSAREAREERVEMLRRMTTRRMMNQAVFSGWTAWMEHWEARTYALQRLRQAASRLRSPELAAAFADWVFSALMRRQARAAAEAKRKAGQLSESDAVCRELEQELVRVRAELATVSEERMNLRERISELDGGVTEAERLRQEAEAKSKEERIELLRRQIGRRMMNADLGRGFTAWVEMWEARAYAQDRLRQVANRLRVPELAYAFNVWAVDVEEQIRLDAVKAMQRDKAGLQSERARLEQELASVRAEYEQRLANSEEQRVMLMARIADLGGGMDSTQAMLEAQATVEKERRIDMLCRMISRRMMRSDLSKGWSAWLEMWEAKTYARQRMREVANRLRAPELASAFTDWVLVYHTERERHLAVEARKKSSLLAQQSSKYKDLEQELVRVRAELATVSEERMNLRERISELDGGVTEAERLRQEAEAKSKEERIELLRRQIGRRMMNADLGRGFTAWVEMWEAKLYARSQLQQCANRLRAPELSFSFSFWLRDWMESKRADELRAYRQREDLLQGNAQTLAAQMQRLREEYEYKLRVAEEAKEIALERQRISLMGTATELAALREQEEKEQRIELLRRQIARRLMNGSLSHGFTAWTEMWEARTWAKSRLREVGNRFRQPGLADAFWVWTGVWEAIKHQKYCQELEKQSKSLESMLSQARFEAGQLDLVRVAQEDRLKEMTSRVRLQEEEIAVKDIKIRGLAETTKQNSELSELMAAAAEAQSIAEQKMQDMEEEASRQHASNRELLERLLAEQRAKFEDDMKEDKARLLSHSQERKRMEEAFDKERDEAKRELKELTKELERTKKELEKLKANSPREKNKKQGVKDTGGKVKTSALGMIDLDEGPDSKPISQQLAEALRANSTRVLDLFRDWDADGDGEVSRAEFRRAMPQLGLDVPVSEVDKLFNEWDKDGGGALSLKELTKILNRARVAGGAPSPPAPSVGGGAKAAMAAIKLQKTIG